ncbi:hypothetical protein [Bacillus sp. RC51]|uniref:hypothetical protein n=1 Tax=Bacillus TaxID=1386 RepID=UPI00384B55F5
MKKTLELCEACKHNPVQEIEESDEANQPYKLCSLEPCIGIDFVGFNNKRHYSHKFNELNPDFSY